MRTESSYEPSEDEENIYTRNINRKYDKRSFLSPLPFELIYEITKYELNLALTSRTMYKIGRSLLYETFTAPYYERHSKLPISSPNMTIKHIKLIKRWLQNLTKNGDKRNLVKNIYFNIYNTRSLKVRLHLNDIFESLERCPKLKYVKLVVSTLDELLYIHSNKLEKLIIHFSATKKESYWPNAAPYISDTDFYNIVASIIENLPNLNTLVLYKMNKYYNNQDRDDRESLIELVKSNGNSLNKIAFCYNTQCRCNQRPSFYCNHYFIIKAFKRFENRVDETIADVNGKLDNNVYPDLIRKALCETIKDMDIPDSCFS